MLQPDPVERVWLYLLERFVSHRPHADQEVVMQPPAQPGTASRANGFASSATTLWIRQITS